MVSPYSDLPAEYYWSSQISDKNPLTINYDPSVKWRFDINTDKFATIGSCFAQHFSRHISERGGHYVEVEKRHPLVPRRAHHGYGNFSARYGNVYTCRQFHELVAQAVGHRPIVTDFFQTKAGRWLDMSRFRAVPDGFSSYDSCHMDRLYHLERVAALFKEATAIVFTMGLTECWINTEQDFCYPVCPGVVEGAFDPNRHKFKNLSFAECLGDLTAAIELIHRENPNLRILLTVSPVMLVATFEPRGALQSSMASKAILRAVADECVRMFDFVDYFPSYEIVAGPQASGRYYRFDHREVSDEGVANVMDVFFKSRFSNLTASQPQRPETLAFEALASADALSDECDEILLGKKGGGKTG